MGTGAERVHTPPVELPAGSVLTPGSCCSPQTPLPDVSQLTPDEMLTIELFKDNT